MTSQNSGMSTFQKESSNISIIIKFSNDTTWMEATDNFIGFLHACGYVFDPVDVADYIMEQYDVTSGITFDVYEAPFPETTESCGYTMCTPKCNYK